MKATKVGVIGAGVSGAMCAHLLRRAGYEVEVFERAAEPGGRASSWRDDSRGLVVDSGAAFFTSFYTRLIKLLPELGLEDEVHQLSRQIDFVDAGRSMRFNASSFWAATWSSMTMPSMGLIDKLRLSLYLARINAQRKRLEWVTPQTLLKLDDLNVAQDAIAQVGKRAYHAFIRQTLEPFWFMPSEMFSRGMFIGMMANSAGAQFYTFPGGIDQISRALLRGLEVNFNAQAVALEAVEQGTMLHWRDAKGEHSKRFDKIVCATTANVAAQLCQGLPESRISQTQRDFLQQQRYCMNAHAAFLIRRERAHVVSQAVPAGPGARDIVAVGLRGEGYPQLRAAGQEIVSVYFSPHASQRYRGLSDAQVFEDVWVRARDFYPDLPAEAEPLHLALREQAIPEFGVGQYQRIVAFQAEQRSDLVFAGDYLAGACIEGALASAERAVEIVLKG